MVRLTHSFWTKPMLSNRWDIKDQLEKNLWITALSIIYAKKSGAYITMHTDSLGYEYLKHFPYDEIFCDLDDLENRMKCNPNNMWAASKSVALANEPIGTIHIDTDVMIKSPKCLEELKFDNYDAIIQHIEISGYKEQQALKKVMPNINMNLRYACNVGVLGFNNESLRKQYLDNYNYYLENLELNEDNYFSCDLILEQLYLYQLFTEQKLNFKFLLGDLRVDIMGQILRKCNEIDYMHLIGEDKYRAPVIAKCKKYVEEMNPNLFEVVSSFQYN